MLCSVVCLIVVLQVISCLPDINEENTNRKKISRFFQQNASGFNRHLKRNIRMIPYHNSNEEDDDDDDDDSEEDDDDRYHTPIRHAFPHSRHFHSHIRHLLPNDHHFYVHKDVYHHISNENHNDNKVPLDKDSIVRLLMQNTIEQTKINQAMIRKHQYDQISTERLREQLNNKEPFMDEQTAISSPQEQFDFSSRNPNQQPFEDGTLKSPGGTDLSLSGLAPNTESISQPFYKFQNVNQQPFEDGTLKSPGGTDLSLSGLASSTESANQPFYKFQNEPLNREDVADQALTMLQSNHFTNQNTLQNAQHIKYLLDQRDMNNELQNKLQQINEPVYPLTIHPDSVQQLAIPPFGNNGISINSLSSNPIDLMQNRQVSTLGNTLAAINKTPFRASPLSTPFENIADSSYGMDSSIINSDLDQKTSLTANGLYDELEANDRNIMKTFDDENILHLSTRLPDENDDDKKTNQKIKNSKKRKKKKSKKRGTKPKRLQRVYKELLSANKTRKKTKRKPEKRQKTENRSRDLRLQKMLDALSQHNTIDAKTIPNNAPAMADENTRSVTSDLNETQNSIPVQKNSSSMYEKTRNTTVKSRTLVYDTVLVPYVELNQLNTSNSSASVLSAGTGNTTAIVDDALDMKSDNNTTHQALNNTSSPILSTLSNYEEYLVHDKLNYTGNRNYTFHDALERIDVLIPNINQLDKTKYKKELDGLKSLAEQSENTLDLEELSLNANNIVRTLESILQQNTKNLTLLVPNNPPNNIRDYDSLQNMKQMNSNRENITKQSVHKKTFEPVMVRQTIRKNYMNYKKLVNEVKRESKSIYAISDSIPQSLLPSQNRFSPGVARNLEVASKRNRENNDKSSNQSFVKKQTLDNNNVMPNNDTWVLKIANNEKRTLLTHSTD